MMDAYSFNLSETDLAETYQNIRKAYLEISRRLLGENIEVTVPGKETGFWARIKRIFGKIFKTILF